MEIKVRAWIPKQNVMLHMKDFPSSLGGFIKMCEEYKEFILMLDIGVEDSSESPIFDGDIIGHYELKFNDEDEEEWMLMNKWEVSYKAEDDYPAFTLEGYYPECPHNSIADMKTNWDNYNKFEVIGNIYEHPHLIEE